MVMKKVTTKQNPDTPVLEMIAGLSNYVTYFMVGIICSCIIYFSSCKFTYEWRILQGEFASQMSLAFFSAAYCLITDGSRIALLLYGLRDFAIGKTSSGYFGIFISLLLTAFAIYESQHIAASIAGSEITKGFQFVYVGFIVTNILALVLEWRMVLSTRGIFQANQAEDLDDEAEEDAAIEKEMAASFPKQNGSYMTTPPMPFSNNFKPMAVPQ